MSKGCKLLMHLFFLLLETVLNLFIRRLGPSLAQERQSWEGTETNNY